MWKKLASSIVVAVVVLSIGAVLYDVFSEGVPPSFYFDGAEYVDNVSKGVMLDVPFISQKEMYCSEASVAMVLEYYGHEGIGQDYVHENIGEYFEEMLPELEEYLQCQYSSVVPYDLRKEIDENDPVVVRLQFGDYRHTVVVVGYEDNFFYVHDPGLEKGYLQVTEDNLAKSWVPHGEGYLAITVE